MLILKGPLSADALCRKDIYGNAMTKHGDPLFTDIVGCIVSVVIYLYFRGDNKKYHNRSLLRNL